MQQPAPPADERRRLKALQALDILDTSPEERFDRLTRLAKRLFDVPIALVSLVDESRQWFKSCQGLGVTQTPRDISFCGHAILGDNIFLVPDAASDTRFHDNPLVTGEPHIRFYAGCPLSGPDGSKLGTLCIIDREPRELDPDDLALLGDLANMAEREIAAIQLATLDELTGISNRRGFEALSKHALGICRRLHRPASLLFFDLDLFKQINDRFGHAEGDRALTDFARLLKATFRDSDVIGRMGGDEFAVLLTNASASEIDTVLQRFGKGVGEFNRDSRCDYQLGYSVGGVAFDPERHASICDLMGAADKQMYCSKREKKAHHEAFRGSSDHDQTGT